MVRTVAEELEPSVLLGTEIYMVLRVPALVI